jgi:1,4-alpha-glucan branching enzyme
MLKKRYISNNQCCKVTFTLPSAIDADAASIVGDFTDWDQGEVPMKRMKDGTWKAEVTLDAGREYQYRYLVNGKEWHNDWEADKYATHPYGGENSVVTT